MEPVALLAHQRARCLNVQRQGRVVGGIEGPRRLLVLEEVDLVGKADPGQGTPRTLGGVLQWRRAFPSLGRVSQPGNRVERPSPEVGVEFDPNTLTASREPQRALGDIVTGIFEDQRLGADLDALRLVGAVLGMWPLPALEVHRNYATTLALDYVHLGDDAEPLGRHRDGSGLEGPGVFRLVFTGRRQAARGNVHPGVNTATIFRISGVRPLPVHPLQVGEARAVHPLVHHAHGHQRDFRGRRVGHAWFSEAGAGRPGLTSVGCSMHATDPASIRPRKTALECTGRSDRTYSGVDVHVTAWKNPPPVWLVRPNMSGPDTGVTNSISSWAVGWPLRGPTHAFRTVTPFD